MKLFVTGATGYIGSVVVEHAVRAGHTVEGLARNKEKAEKLSQLGAPPVFGDLHSFEVLSAAASRADAVLHLAYIHDFTMDYEEVLRIDASAVDALSEPLGGTGKAFVITSGTAVVDPAPDGSETTEDSPLSGTFILKDRIRSERHALRLSEGGVRVSAIRLPPYVYGRGGSYFVPLLMRKAAELGESIYVDEGHLRTSAVHVDDAAKLYLLATDSAKPGDIFNGTGSTTTTLRELAEAIGAALEVPVRSVSRAQAEADWGQFLTAFVQFENRASNRKAVQRLGWHPKGIDILTDIKSGSYRDLALELRRSAAAKSAAS